MKKILIIARKEFGGYFRSGVGVIFAGLLLSVAAWMFWGDIFVSRQADVRPYFGVVIFLLALFVPAISMGLIAEEKKNGNWEMLLSLPISEWQVVLGKFIGSSWYLLLTIGLMGPSVATVWWLGRPDVGVVIGNIVGVGLLAMCYLGVGLLASAMCSQPVVAFLVSTAFLLINNLMGQAVVLEKVPLMLRGLVEFLSLSWRTNRFGNGLLEIGDLVFYSSFVTICLMLTVLTLKNRHK